MATIATNTEEELRQASGRIPDSIVDGMCDMPPPVFLRDTETPPRAINYTCAKVGVAPDLHADAEGQACLGDDCNHLPWGQRCDEEVAHFDDYAAQLLEILDAG